MRKGQVFSIDFIIAMSLVILILGTLLVFVERNNFETLEKEQQEQLLTKLGGGMQGLFASKEFLCVAGTHEIAYSLDISKLVSKKDTIKAVTGLSDYNVQLQIAGTIPTIILDDQLSGPRVYATDMNILVCDNSNKLTSTDFFSCESGDCYAGHVHTQTVHFGVSQ